MAQPKLTKADLESIKKQKELIVKSKKVVTK